MKLKGIIDIDFVNYKKTSMVLEFPYCSFKCDKECGKQVCQNSKLASAPNIEISIEEIVKRYTENDIVEAIVLQGLEPFDSYEDLYQLIVKFREVTNDDIVIYTGYTEEEAKEKFVNPIKDFKNIVVKYGRFIPNQDVHWDNTLGVFLASNNQYAKQYR